jgi:hypothetical protein
VAAGAAGHVQAEAGVVQGGVLVSGLGAPEAGLGRTPGQDPVEGDPGPDLPAGPGSPGSGRDAEAQPADPVRGQAQVPFPLDEGLANQAQRPLLQVAKPPVEELGGAAAGPRPPVPPLDQGDPQAPERRVPGHPGPVDPAAHHQEIVMLLAEPPPFRPVQEGDTHREAHRPRFPGRPAAILGP